MYALSPALPATRKKKSIIARYKINLAFDPKRVSSLPCD